MKRKHADTPLKDWTVGRDGRANTSLAYLNLVGEVEQLLRNSGHDLVNGNVTAVARLIVSHLAHFHGVGPQQ